MKKFRLISVSVLALICTLSVIIAFGSFGGTKVKAESDFFYEADYTVNGAEVLVSEEAVASENLVIANADGVQALQMIQSFSLNEFTEGYVIYKLSAGDRTFDKLDLSIKAHRIANYLESGEIKLAVLCADTQDGVYTTIGEMVAQATPINNIPLDLSAYAKGKSVVFVKFYISYTNEVNPSGHEWCQFEKFTFTGSYEPKVDKFSYTADYTEAGAEVLVSEEAVAYENLVIANADGVQALQMIQSFSLNEFTEGYVIYKLNAGERREFNTLALEIVAHRIANYLESGEIKLAVLCADTKDGAYTTIGEMVAQATPVNNIPLDLSNYAKGKSVVFVKFYISYTNEVNPSGHEWCQFEKFIFTGTLNETSEKTFERNYSYTESDASLETNTELVATENLVLSGGHLQMAQNFSTFVDDDNNRVDVAGYLIYKLSAGNNYGFKSLSFDVLAERIANYDTGEIKVAIYLSDTLDGTYTLIGDYVATGSAINTLNGDLTEYVLNKSVVFAKLVISYSKEVPAYGHDWTQINRVSFNGIVDLVPVAMEPQVYNYSELTPGSTMYDVEDSKDIALVTVEGHTVLQRKQDGGIHEAYVVYKYEVPNDGVFNTLNIHLDGRFLHNVEYAGGTTGLEIQVKCDDGDYVTVLDKTYFDNNDNYPTEEEVDASEVVAGANTVYVKIILKDNTTVTFAHDWVNLTKTTINGTWTFIPIDDDGIARFTVTYAKESDEIGKIPQDKKAYEEGAEVTLLNTSMKKEGFDFAGWLCSADNNVYQPGSKYIMGTENVEFTATWDATEYEVTYVAGLSEEEYTGNLPEALIKHMGDEITLPELEINAPGYRFDGWSINGFIYQPNDTFIIPNGNVEIGIKWFDETLERTTINLSDDEYVFMDEFVATFLTRDVNKGKDALSNAYEVYNLIIRENNEGTATNIQLPQGPADAFGFFTMKLSAGAGLTFDELVSKFSGRVAVYLDPASTSNLSVYASIDNTNWTFIKSIDGSGNPASEYTVDLTEYAQGKEIVYVRYEYSVHKFPDFGAEWVAMSALEFSGVTSEESQAVEKITIKLYVDGSIYKEESIDKGGIYTPQEPTKDGYKFVGWYLDDSLKTEYAGGQPLNADTSLYAKFEKEKTKKGCRSALPFAVLPILGFAGLIVAKKRK